MQTRLNPYIGFRDSARAALEFYQGVFGGEVYLSTFKEFHASQDPSEDDKIMHGMLDGPNGLTLMASDAPNSMEVDSGSSISISLSGEDEAELRGYWNSLSQGATVTMPLESAPWGDTFGMLTDKFGVNWMVNIAGRKA